MSIRARKVAQQLKKELSFIFQQGLKDPRFGFVTVTSVSVSPDLRNAKVYVSVLGNKREEAPAFWTKTLRYIRREIGQCLDLRVIPKITLVLDRSQEKTDRIAALLNEERGSQGE